jgi:hypothetical protein
MNMDMDMDMAMAIDAMDLLCARWTRSPSFPVTRTCRGSFVAAKSGGSAGPADTRYLGAGAGACKRSVGSRHSDREFCDAPCGGPDQRVR